MSNLVIKNKSSNNNVNEPSPIEKPIDIADRQDVINQTPEKLIDATFIVDESDMISNSDYKTPTVKSVANFVRASIINAAKPESVTKVFGRSGNVEAKAGDYACIQISHAPRNNLTDTNLQNTLYQLDDIKLDKSLYKSKGDLITYNGSNIRTIIAGKDGQVLTADSSAENGVKWSDIKSQQIKASDVEYTPFGDVNSKDVQNAINEVDSKKLSKYILKTKGDLYAQGTSVVERLPVGKSNQILSVDFTETTGLKWIDNPSNEKVHSTVLYYLSANANKYINDNDHCPFDRISTNIDPNKLQSLGELPYTQNVGVHCTGRVLLKKGHKFKVSACLIPTSSNGAFFAFSIYAVTSFVARIGTQATAYADTGLKATSGQTSYAFIETTQDTLIEVRKTAGNLEAFSAGNDIDLSESFLLIELM